MGNTNPGGRVHAGSLVLSGFLRLPGFGLCKPIRSRLTPLHRRGAPALSPRKRRLTEDEVAEEMRMQQIGSFEEVQWAILETNGHISFVKK